MAYCFRLIVMTVVVVALTIMVGSAVANVAPAPSFLSSRSSQDGSKDEALCDGKSAQTDPNCYGTKEEGLNSGTQRCNQHDAKKQGMLHCFSFEELLEIVRSRKAGQIK